MRWKRNDKKVTTSAVPLYVKGEDFDFTMTLSLDTGESFANAYLCVVDSDLAGYVSAKHHADATYLPISGPNVASCSLGGLTQSTEYSIDFRVNIPANAVPDGNQFFHFLVVEGDDTGAVVDSSIWGDVADFRMWQDVASAPMWSDL